MQTVEISFARIRVLFDDSQKIETGQTTRKKQTLLYDIKSEFASTKRCGLSAERDLPL
jgi:hypothetical protein